MFNCNILFIIFFIVFALASRTRADNDNFPTNFAAADVNIGERLFLEARFSEYFFASSSGDANAAVPGEPVVTTLKTASGFVPGPFAGQAMNCRQCHLVDEEGYGTFGNHTLGNRTYADFASRSPLPTRDDGLIRTPRNAIGLVDAFLPHNAPLFLHYDGRFTSARDLIIATLTEREYGWKPSEYATAVHHIASIIRNDNGLGYLALTARGGRWAGNLPGQTAYAHVFSGFTNYSGSYLYDPHFLIKDIISPRYQLDMRSATDEQILNTIASLIEAYLRNLFFSQAANGLDFEGNGTPIFNGSPFDVFLIKNNLPRFPDASETPIQYNRRLLQLVTQRRDMQFVTDPADGQFLTQTQLFQFGPRELQGLKIFLANKNSPLEDRLNGTGNCAACHSLPAFTDFIFHNTGASQEEYDALHGPGSFQKLAVPGYATRQTNYDAYLPPTPNHPQATGIFETPPATNNPVAADLGLWNVYANPDFPAPQAGLLQILPQMLRLTSPQMPSPAEVLPRTLALFKTPTLRDLGQSAPYLHTGRMNTIEDVIKFYINFSNNARLGEVRNADPELQNIFLDDSSIAPLAAFLRSLNEDYTD